MGFSIGSLINTAGQILGLAGTAKQLFGGGGGTSVGPTTIQVARPGFSEVNGFVQTGSAAHRAAEPFASPFILAGAVPAPLILGAARVTARFGAAFIRKAILLARELGIVAAASVLGITALELAEIVTKPRRRRRRGITAAQIRTTKATIRRMDSLNRSIADVCPPRARRRAPSRAAIHHAK